MIQSIIQQLCDRYEPTGLGVAYVCEDTTWAGGFDWADKAARRFVQADTAFRIGSITKLFTATMLMRLCEQGIVQLDDPVSRWLPAFQMRWQDEPYPVTLYELATHTSGLPRMMPFGPLADPFAMMQADLAGGAVYPTVEELAAFVWQAEFRPKSRSEYSNMGLALLGAALAAAANQPYRDWIAQHILQPLGMRNSGFDYAVLAPRATGYLGQMIFDMMGEDIDEVAPVPDIGAFAPAGQLSASARDLLPFMQAFLGSEALISAESIETMLTPCQLLDGSATDQAIGWQTERVADVDAFAHGGFDYGFSSYMIVLPQRQIGVVCLSNDGMSESIADLTRDVVKALFAACR